MNINDIIEIAEYISTLIGSLENVRDSNDNEVIINMINTMLDNVLYELEGKIADYIQTEPADVDLETFIIDIADGINTLIASLESVLDTNKDELVANFVNSILDNSLYELQKLIESYIIEPAGTEPPKEPTTEGN